MKSFTEYTKAEKDKIIQKGGDAKKELEKSMILWLNGFHFSKEVEAVINTADPIVELFGTCETKKEVETIAKLVIEE